MMAHALTDAMIELALDRLFSLLPTHIRAVDAASGRSLEALFRILAEGDAEIDAAIEALFDNQFIETADPDTLDHFAALTGTPRLSPLPAGAAHNFRSFIANSVRYNRGKGTARTLEQLAADVAGFGAVAVEYFQRQAKLQHALDFDIPRPGTAALVPGETAALSGRAFDTLPRVTDVRSIDGAQGRHHFDNVGLHVVRFATPTWPAPTGAKIASADLAAVPEARAWEPAGSAHAGYFQLAAQPSERLALFNPDRRDMGRFERPDMTDLADRLRRLPLYLETAGRRHAAIEGRPFEASGETWFGADADPFVLYFRRTGETDFSAVPSEEIKIANLEDAPVPVGFRPDPIVSHDWFASGSHAPTANSGTHPIACAFDPVTGRLVVSKPAAGQPDVAEVRIAHSFGRGALIGGGPYERNAADVPFEVIDRAGVTNFVRVVDRLSVPSGGASAGRRTVQSLAQALSDWAAHGAGKTGWIILTRCDREHLPGAATEFEVALHPDTSLSVVAAEWRPNVDKANGVVFDANLAGFLVRRERGAVIEGAVVLHASAAPPPDGRAGQCTFDGLELTKGLQLRKDACDRLDLRHCTVRNPGSTAIGTSAALTGCEIVIDRSILGKCRFDFGSAAAQARLSISNSILFGDAAGAPVLAARSCDTEMCGVTLFGEVLVRSLDATNILFTEPVETVRRQAGCVRYSFVPPGSTTSRRFRCLPDIALARRAEERGNALTAEERTSEVLGSRPVFLDTEPDAPGFAMLHSLCPDSVALGGEGESEMGAFALTATRLRLRNMTRLFDRFLPFGMRAAILDDTQSRISVEQGNRP